MASQETYRKDASGNVLVRVVRTQKDINDVTFTTRDTEEVVHPVRQLRRLKQALAQTREELTELKTEKARLIDRIAAIETARDS